jgi:PEP-CTERM motif
MAHYRWIYLAGVAAAACSSAAIAGSGSSAPGDTRALSTYAAGAINGELGDDLQQGDNDQYSKGHHDDDQGEGDDMHGKGDNGHDDGKGHHGKGHQDDDDQGNNQRGDDNQGNGHGSGGPPVRSKPGTGGSTGGHGVPEPGTDALLAAALLGLATRQLRRRPRIFR